MKKNISEFCTYKEGVRSTTALRLGIKNIPTKSQLEAMEIVAAEVFVPVRNFINRPIGINSFFRCEELNTAIGGSTKSQHCKGQGMDLDVIYGDNTNAKIFNFIKENLEFDQMIWEFGDDENPDWVHVSYVGKISNRNRCLRARRTNGKVTYEVI